MYSHGSSFSIQKYLMSFSQRCAYLVDQGWRYAAIVGSHFKVLIGQDRDTNLLAQRPVEHGISARLFCASRISSGINELILVQDTFTVLVIISPVSDATSTLLAPMRSP
jgi:hypothetical protein